MEKEFETAGLITNYYAMAKTNAPEENKKAERNKIIDGRLALINLNYNQFIAQFSVTRQTLDFGTEITQLGLNLATTAVGGESTKTILGAISSGVTGGKIAIDKNFFFEKTVSVLVSSMNAQRKVMLAPLLIGMTNSTTVYPLTQALADIDAYYFAGTFIGALQAIQADAGSKEIKADEKLDTVRATKFVADDAGDRLRSYWMSQLSGTVTITSNTDLVVGVGTHFTNELAVGDKITVGPNARLVQTITDDFRLTTSTNFTASRTNVTCAAIHTDHQTKIENWLETNALSGVPIQTFLTGDLFSEKRKKAVKDLNIQPSK